MATGFKTKNGMLSTTSDRGAPKTVLEKAEEANFNMALMTNESITEATIAAFSVHMENKKNHDEISAQLLEDEIEILFG